MYIDDLEPFNVHMCSPLFFSCATETLRPRQWRYGAFQIQNHRGTQNSVAWRSDDLVALRVRAAVRLSGITTHWSERPVRRFVSYEPKQCSCSPLHFARVSDLKIARSQLTVKNVYEERRE